MIAIYTELLEEKQGSQFDAESSKYVGMVRDSARRLESLVDDLLMYSRAIHDDAGAELTETERREALLVATNNLKAQIERAGAVITTSELPKLTAHPVHLIQIFQNLVGNALKYHGPEPPRITLSAVNKDNAAIFSVKDNGIGISPNYHETIFVPFKRLHGQQFPGSGVRLAICRRIV